jgi:hypothetical protein
VNYLQLAYAQGVKIAADELGLSFEDIMKMAASPPPIPSVVAATSRLKALAQGAAKPMAQAATQVGKQVPVGAGRSFQSAFTPDVLARLGGGV